MKGYIVSAISIIIFCYMAWHGWKLDFKSGKIDFSFEIYPLKRFYKKEKTEYKPNEVVESKPEDAF